MPQYLVFKIFTVKEIANLYLQGSQWRLKSDFLLLKSVIGFYGDYFDIK